MEPKNAKFPIGQVVKHRLFDFRGVIFDVDPQFNNTEEWYNAIPAKDRPPKNQPYYHLLAENSETEYIAYVSEQNLLVDDSRAPVTPSGQRLFWFLRQRQWLLCQKVLTLQLRPIRFIIRSLPT